MADKYTLEPPSGQAGTGAFTLEPPSKYTLESPNTTQPPQAPTAVSNLEAQGIPSFTPPAEDNSTWPQWFQTALEAANKYAVQPFEHLAKKGTELGGQLAGGFPEQWKALANDPNQPPEVRARAQQQLDKYSKENQIARGVGIGLGELGGGLIADPRNWPFLGADKARPLLQKLISGGFGIMMGHQAIEQAGNLMDNWDKLSTEQRASGLTQLGAAGVMAGMTGTHAIVGSHGPVHLTPEENAFILDMVSKHLDEALKAGDSASAEEALAGFNVMANKGVEHGRTPTEQASQDIHPREGRPDRGPVHSPSAEAIASVEAPLPRAEDIRDNIPTPRGGGHAEAATEPSAGAEGDGGTPTQGDLKASIGELISLVPALEKESGVRGKEGGAEPPAESTPTSTGRSVEPNPPVISQAIDNDLAAGGIQVVEHGKDMWLTGRFLGSLAESARLLNEQGHPLGSVLTSMAGFMSDVGKAITRNQINTIKEYISGAKKITSPKEWTNQVVGLMDDPNVTPSTRPANVPNNVWDAYTTARNIDERLRVGIRDAKRKELALRGIDPQTASQWIPDDWGMVNGHYHHAFPGTWTITKLAGVDAKGNPIYEPIETGWRSESKFSAQAKAVEYLKSNPNEQIKIEQDTVTLPGKSLSDRVALREITDHVKQASAVYAKGGDVDQILKDIYDESAASAYGPKYPARRQFGPALERESNLPGWARDRENFERYLMASERYIQLAPARQLLLQARNKIATLAGMPPIQKVGEMPSLVGYSSAKQYGNILARVDSAIEGLEGHPGAWDAVARYSMNQMGLDPNLISNLTRPMQTVSAFIKLGLNPARVLSHGLQSMWAVYPVLGEKASIQGVAHAFDPRYKWLIDDLAVEHGMNASDIEGLHAYVGNYFGKGSNPIDWAKGTAGILRDIGMMPFSFGIEFTRRMAAVGGYIQATERGFPPTQARAYARDVLDRTTGNYNAADNSPFLRQLPGPVAQFKSFLLKTGQFMWGLRGGEIPRFLAAVGVLGFSGFPFLKSMSNLIQNTTGENVENELKRAFPVASRGAFGLLGLDIPTGVGLGDLSITRSNTPLSGLAGPAASDIIALGGALAKQAIKGPSRQAQQELDDAMRNLSPEARRVWDEAVRLGAGKGRTIDPHTGSTLIGNLTTKERIESILGLTPLRVSEERDTHEYIRNQIAQYKDKRGFFVDKLAELQLDLADPKLSPGGRVDAIRQTLEYSKSAEEYGVAKDLAKVVRERAREMQIERLTRDIRKAPRPERFPAYQEQQRYILEQPH